MNPECEARRAVAFSCFIATSCRCGQPGVSGRLLRCNPLLLARALTEYNPSLPPFAQRSACFVSASREKRHHGQAWLLVAASAANAVTAWLSLSEGGKLEGVGTYEALSSKATAETIVPAGTSVSRSEAPWIRA